MNKIWIDVRRYLGSKKRNTLFFFRHWKLAKTQKILYMLTPGEALANVGDQAQAVAILRWLRRHFPEFPILEVDKKDVTLCMKAVKKLARKDDIIMIHSGGNLMDRAPVSEYGRRSIILNFPENQIISLPQTIYFTDTENGLAEKRKTEEIYNMHNNLTIVSRDYHSAQLANQMFPKCQRMVLPDFVLSLDNVYTFSSDIALTDKVLLCLRKDTQSTLNEETYRNFYTHVNAECEYFDTTLGRKFDLNRREEVLLDVLKYFRSFKAVVTDRFHGLIFSILTRRPCVVYPTIDHKLTSGVEWFDEIESVQLAEGIDDINDKLKKALAGSVVKPKNWNRDFFDSFAEILRVRLELPTISRKVDNE